MKRSLVLGMLVVFACSSIFLISRCTKKKLITEGKEITAPPAEEITEAAKVEPGPAKAPVTEVETEEALKRAEAVRLEELELAKKREAAEAWKERRAVRFKAEAIFFDFDKSFIRPEYRPVLEEKAEFLRENPDVKIRIEGNCDERGTNEYNLALGERRANSAKEFLVLLGISADRIETISYGEERHLVLGHNEDSWSQNRRDDFVIAPK